MKTTEIGKLGELEFELQSFKCGLICAQTNVENQPGFDRLVFPRLNVPFPRTIRTQIKKSLSWDITKSGYNFTLANYNENSFDVLSLCVGQKSEWYHIPMNDLLIDGRVRTSVSINPNSKNNQWYVYKENWDLFDDIQEEMLWTQSDEERSD